MNKAEIYDLLRTRGGSVKSYAQKCLQARAE